MTTTEQTIWSFDKTGTVQAVEAELRQENFGGKNALALRNAAIDYLSSDPREAGARVAIKEKVTDTGHRYVEMVIVDLPLLTSGGERHAREM